jgi:hypothetical protein
MNHLPFIVAAYLAAAVIIGGLALGSWQRMRRAEREE